MPESQKPTLTLNNTAAKAAAGFHTEEIKSEQDAEFQFLFTRAIEFRFVLMSNFGWVNRSVTQPIYLCYISRQVRDRRLYIAQIIQIFNIYHYI